MNAAAAFATFVNRNHAAGLLNIALGGAIGLAIWSFGRSRDRRPARETADAFGMRACLAGLNGWQLLSLVLMTLISAGILCTLSRGAWLAAVCAAVVTAVALGIGKRAGRHTWTWLSSN